MNGVRSVRNGGVHGGVLNMNGSKNIKSLRSELFQKLNDEVVGNELFSHSGFSAKQTLVYSSATTRIWVLTYTINRKRYADLYAVCIPGKEYYTSKSQIMTEYFPTLIKRFGKIVDELRKRGYKVTGSQMVFVGNFSSDLITLLKDTKEVFGVRTSIRALPFGKTRRFHRIKKLVVKTRDDVIAAMLYWLGVWFRERWENLCQWLKSKGENPQKNKLAKVIHTFFERVMVKVSMMDVLPLLEPPP